MFETISLDARTIIVKAENANDLSELLAFISKRDKQNNIVSFLELAAHNRVLEKGYKFNRDDCYDG